ncbi:LysM peptidoglycan-binding domain-containing protein [Patescibacteria group bacterium]
MSLAIEVASVTRPELDLSKFPDASDLKLPDGANDLARNFYNKLKDINFEQWLHNFPRQRPPIAAELSSEQKKRLKIAAVILGPPLVMGGLSAALVSQKEADSSDTAKVVWGEAIAEVEAWPSPDNNPSLAINKVSLVKAGLKEKLRLNGEVSAVFFNSHDQKDTAGLNGVNGAVFAPVLPLVRGGEMVQAQEDGTVKYGDQEVGRSVWPLIDGQSPSFEENKGEIFAVYSLSQSETVKIPVVGNQDPLLSLSKLVPAEEQLVLSAVADVNTSINNEQALQQASCYKVVKFGPSDNLPNFARSHGVHPTAILAANGVGSEHALWNLGNVRVPITCPETKSNSQGVSSGGSSSNSEAYCGSVWVVKKGQALYSIATRCGRTVNQFAEYNELKDPNKIYAGQRLMVPPQGYKPPANSSKKQPNPIQKTGNTITEVQPANTPEARQFPETYQLKVPEVGKSGSESSKSLPYIALLTNCSPEQIMAVNPDNQLLKAGFLPPGETITIPNSCKGEKAQQLLEKAVLVPYQVEPGDSLVDLAVQNKSTVWGIVNANEKIDSSADLVPGQEILIPVNGKKLELEDKLSLGWDTLVSPSEYLKDNHGELVRDEQGRAVLADNKIKRLPEGTQVEVVGFGYDPDFKETVHIRATEEVIDPKTGEVVVKRGDIFQAWPGALAVSEEVPVGGVDQATEKIEPEGPLDSTQPKVAVIARSLNNEEIIVDPSAASWKEIGRTENEVIVQFKRPDETFDPRYFTVSDPKLLEQTGSVVDEEDSQVSGDEQLAELILEETILERDLFALKASGQEAVRLDQNEKIFVIGEERESGYLKALKWDSENQRWGEETLRIRKAVMNYQAPTEVEVNIDDFVKQDDEANQANIKEIIDSGQEVNLELGSYSVTIDSESWHPTEQQVLAELSQELMSFYDQYYGSPPPGTEVVIHELSLDPYPEFPEGSLHELAQAYTRGSHIYLGRDHFKRGRNDLIFKLACELAHTWGVPPLVGLRDNQDNPIGWSTNRQEADWGFGIDEKVMARSAQVFLDGDPCQGEYCHPIDSVEILKKYPDFFLKARQMLEEGNLEGLTSQEWLGWAEGEFPGFGEMWSGM